VTGDESHRRGGRAMRGAENEGLGLWGNLVLHSQYLFIGLLVLGALILKVFYR